MSWMFSCSSCFEQTFNNLPLHRRNLIQEKIEAIKEGKDPLETSYPWSKGRVAFTFVGRMVTLICQVDHQEELLVFERIQIQKF